MQPLPPLRVVKGYWTAKPWIKGVRKTWTFGNVNKVTQDQAMMALAAQWSSAQRLSNSDPTLQELADAFLEHARATYRRDNGSLTGESDNLFHGIAPLADLFGALPAREIRPRHFAVFSNAQAKLDVSRQVINRRIGMVKRMLKWGAQEDLVPAETYQACSVVGPMRPSPAVRESMGVTAVPLPQVEQTKPYLPQVIQNMIDLELLTAMRPEEVCAMRLIDIEMASSPWLYVPAWHKNKHRGLQRRIFLGTRAQQLLAPYLAGKKIESNIFSPQQAVFERRGKYPKQRVDEYFDTRSYRRAIWYACDRAFPLPDNLKRQRVPAGGRKGKRLESKREWRARLGPLWTSVEAWRSEHRWSPNRLRHTALDAIRRAEGAQAAKAVAGHSRVETTQDHYLSQDDSVAKSYALKAG